MEFDQQREVLDHCRNLLVQGGPYRTDRQARLLERAGHVAGTTANVPEGRRLVDAAVQRERDEENVEIAARPLAATVPAALAAWAATGASPDVLAEEFCALFRAPDRPVSAMLAGAAQRAAHWMAPERVASLLQPALLVQLASDPYPVLEDARLALWAKLFADTGLAGAFQAAAAPMDRLHFFWAGREIRRPAAANIAAWCDRARDTPWTVTLWTDYGRTEWPPSVMQALHQAGVAFQDVRQVLDPRLEAAYGVACTTNWAAASDLVRVSALHRHGGIYCDVDIAPGAFRLQDAPRVPLLGLPHFAPGLRDRASVNVALDRPEHTGLTQSDIDRAVRLQTFRGTFNSNFLMAPAGSVFLDPMINGVDAGTRPVLGVRDVWVGDGVFGLTGADRLKPAIRTVLALTHAVPFHVADDLMKRDVVTRLPLTWLTEASEDTVNAPVL